MDLPEGEVPLPGEKDGKDTGARKPHLLVKRIKKENGLFRASTSGEGGSHAVRRGGGYTKEHAGSIRMAIISPHKQIASNNKRKKGGKGEKNVLKS